VTTSLEKVAEIVDKQNADTAGYEPLCADLDNSTAFQAAKDLIFLGTTQPNGYTEPLLHQHRINKKLG